LKVLDAELDEQLCRALVNAQWMRLLARQYSMVSTDVQNLAAHLGIQHKLMFPEVSVAVNSPMEPPSTVFGADGRVSTPPRGRTPSPPHIDLNAE